MNEAKDYFIDKPRWSPICSPLPNGRRKAWIEYSRTYKLQSEPKVSLQTYRIRPRFSNLVLDWLKEMNRLILFDDLMLSKPLCLTVNHRILCFKLPKGQVFLLMHL